MAEPTKFSNTDAALIGRAALRKASWRMIPLLALGYGIAYMDRINISFASLQMNRDLQLQRQKQEQKAKTNTGVSPLRRAKSAGLRSR